MKVSSFLLPIILSLLLLVLVFFGAVRVSPMEAKATFEESNYELPFSAKFIPKESDLSIHWNINPKELPQYLKESIHQKRGKEGVEDFKLVRNGAFSLMSLDFKKDLSNWIGPQGSFAVLINEDKTIEDEYKWILCLSIANKKNANNFIKRFWELRSIDGISLEKSEFKNAKIISAKEVKDLNPNQKISTALLDDEFILISSNKFLLDKSLNSSINNDANQLGNMKNSNLLDKVNNGIAIAIGKPTAAKRWLGLPFDFDERNSLNQFIFSINPIKDNLYLDGIIIGLENIKKANDLSISKAYLIDNSGSNAQKIYLIDDGLNNSQPNKEASLPLWIEGFIRKDVSKSSMEVAEMIMQLTEKPMILIKEPSGFLIGTSHQPNLKETIDLRLKSKGFHKTILKRANLPLTIWSKPTINRAFNNGELEMVVGSILKTRNGYDWWGDSLSAIEESGLYNKEIETKDQLSLIKKIPPESFSYEFYFNRDEAKESIKQIRPFKLIKMVSGNFLEENLNGLLVGLKTEPDVDKSAISIKAILDID